MRVLNWNISHGGGSRISAICRHIDDFRPDLLALTEFQTRNEPSLRAHLERLGYPFIVTSNSAANQNGLLVASKWQLENAAVQYTPEIDGERWLAVRLDDLDLDVLVIHIPGAPDNKFEDGYGISGAERKELPWERIITCAVNHANRRAIMMGDFNTGFIDTWRHQHPHARGLHPVFKRKDKTAGKSQDLNGFRLDYIFVSPALRHAIAEVAILHEPRTTGASDHASVIANIDVQDEDAYTTDNDADGNHISEITPLGNLQARFDIAPGSLPDMTCGLNGRNLCAAIPSHTLHCPVG